MSHNCYITECKTYCNSCVIDHFSLRVNAFMIFFPEKRELVTIQSESYRSPYSLQIRAKCETRNLIGPFVWILTVLIIMPFSIFPNFVLFLNIVKLDELI